MKTNLKIIITLAILAASVFAAEEKQPPRRSWDEIIEVLKKAPRGVDLKKGVINIILVAGPKDHGPGEHNYPLWQQKWTKLLNTARPVQYETQEYPKPLNLVNVSVAEANEWPSEEQFKAANLIVMNSWGRWNEKKIKDLEEYLSRGGGFVSVHPALITDKQFSERLAKLLGLAWEHKYSGYRYGPMKLKIVDSNDPICLGLPKEIDFVDEAYWPLKGDVNNIKVLATSDEKNAKDPNIIRPEPMFWTYQYGKGKVFGCILGHYDQTFDDPYLRILLLRGMAWAAGESPYRFDKLVLIDANNVD